MAFLSHSSFTQCSITVTLKIQFSLAGKGNPYSTIKMLHFLLQLTEGSGSILVVAVGVNTEYGKTMSLVMTEAASTPLQEHLEVLATSIGKVGCVVAVVCFCVLLIRLALLYSAIQN